MRKADLPNFCPNEKETTEEEVQISIQELGRKFEECVEKILQTKGYETQRRIRVKGKSGTPYEIDIVAKKGNIVRAVECKNWTNAVGREHLEKFWGTLQDLGSPWNGIFVSRAGFTADAEGYADYYNIERWDPDRVKEEWFELSIGRAEYAKSGETITVSNALPLNFDFLHTTKVDLENKEKVSVTGMISYHPYFIVNYSYYTRFKDPTKATHTFKDEGKVFVDGLDGTVLNPPPTKSVGTVVRTLKLIVSKEAREENTRNKRLIEELRTNLQLKEYNVKGGECYKVRVLKAVVSPRSIVKSAVEYITKKNTETIKYRTKEQEEEYFIPPKTLTYVPKSRDINIKSILLVNVPRWDLSFEALSKTYSREVLACSGTVLEDTLKHCPRHIGPFRKETIAICEICGQAFCEKHVSKCPTCGKWLCEEHGIFCHTCQRRFCSEHIQLKCDICGQRLCNDCKAICPLCKRVYGRQHTLTCEKCGKQVCPECATISGLLRKKTICKECQS